MAYVAGWLGQMGHFGLATTGQAWASLQSIAPHHGGKPPGLYKCTNQSVEGKVDMSCALIQSQCTTFQNGPPKNVFSQYLHVCRQAGQYVLVGQQHLYTFLGYSALALWMVLS